MKIEENYSILPMDEEKNIELIKLDNRLRKRFNKACADYGLICDGDHILIGLSGGKDSLALCEFLGDRAKIYVPRFKVTAVHIRMKEIAYESDTKYLEEFCATHSVQLIVRETSISEPEKASEHTQKNHCFLCSWYRRKALFDVAKELGCNKIALGHHKDDIIETLLMNLIYQGTFATNAPLLVMDKFPMQVIRPLCLIEEKEIIRYAAMKNYQKQAKVCPFEKESSRSEIKQLVQQLERLNPNIRESVWGAMENIKTDYLPHKINS